MTSAKELRFPELSLPLVHFVFKRFFSQMYQRKSNKSGLLLKEKKSQS